MFTALTARMHMVYTFGLAPAVLALVTVAGKHCLPMQRSTSPIRSRHWITKSDN